jgi:hypothetical protein
MNKAPKLISINEGRAMLGGLGRTRIYELIAIGDLPVVKVGRRTFFVEADLIAFVERLPRGSTNFLRSHRS